MKWTEASFHRVGFRKLSASRWCCTCLNASKILSQRKRFHHSDEAIYSQQSKSEAVS